jgi:hypothetical protein
MVQRHDSSGDSSPLNRIRSPARVVGGYEESMGAESLADLYNRTRDATDTLHARAEEALKLAEQLEELTKGTLPGTPARGPGWRRGPRWSRRRTYAGR